MEHSEIVKRSRAELERRQSELLETLRLIDSLPPRDQVAEELDDVNFLLRPGDSW